MRDEFFGGYSRYYTLNSSKKWSIFSFVSVLIKKFNLQNSHLKRLQRFLKAISEKIPYKRNALLLTMESEYSKPTDILNNKWKKNIKGINPFLEYKRVYNNTELAKDIPFSFLLLCKLLRILDNIKNEIIYKNNIK